MNAHTNPCPYQTEIRTIATTRLALCVLCYIHAVYICRIIQHTSIPELRYLDYQSQVTKLALAKIQKIQERDDTRFFLFFCFFKIMNKIVSTDP